MVTHYPTKRSVLVPTLLYAQDEAGFLSDEVIEEIAGRLDLTELEVRNVISYYSMLTTKPRGRYNVQICTNIACMLRGGEELLEHCEKRLGVGHKETTSDGLFSLEEVECIGACSWAPAAQVNYDFHENLTATKVWNAVVTMRTVDNFMRNSTEANGTQRDKMIGSHLQTQLLNVDGKLGLLLDNKFHSLFVLFVAHIR